MDSHRGSSSSAALSSKDCVWGKAIQVQTQTSQAAPNAVKAEDLSVFLGTRCLLKNADLTVAEQLHTSEIEAPDGTTKHLRTGACYGLVGVNGCGKSTLLRLIAEGRLPVPSAWDVFIVNQHLPEAKDVSIVDDVLSANLRRQVLLDEQSTLEEKVSKLADGRSEEFLEATKNLLELETRLSRWDDAVLEVTNILLALGFRASDGSDSCVSVPTVDARMNKLSGGWRMKVQLAKALWLQPKLLLLDEPTNHLDFRSLQWLETKLEQYPYTSVVVSHDVSFLHSVCREILWLKDLKIEVLPREIVSQEELLRMQRSRELKFTFMTPDDNEVASEGLSLHGVAFSFDPSKGSGRRHQPVHLQVKKEVRFSGRSRSVLLGKNGGGKSTFLDLCAGRLMPTRGSIDRTPDLKVGHFSQFTDQLDKNSKDTAASLLVKECGEELAKRARSTRASRLQASLAADGDKPVGATAKRKAAELTHKRLMEIARGELSNFGFEGDVSVMVPIDCLSGGQKALLKLALLSLQPVHILLLDEPSNHLDAEACEALANGLSEFKGGIVAVTHDELLIYRLINCNWTSSELLICREGSVWRERDFGADSLKALRKEAQGAEETAVQSDEKRQRPSATKQESAEKQQAVSTKVLPPWLQRRGRARDRKVAADSVPEVIVEDRAADESSTPVDETQECAEHAHGVRDASAEANIGNNSSHVNDLADRDANSSLETDQMARETGKPRPKRTPKSASCNSSQTPAEPNLCTKTPEDENEIEANVSQAPSKFIAPAVLRNISRNPTEKPNETSAWDDELWQLRRFYERHGCDVQGGPDGERILRLTHHCSDPDWEAEEWAPEGLHFELVVPCTYPEISSDFPSLCVKGPAGLPEKFCQVISALFSDVVSRAPPMTPAVHRSLQAVDKNLTLVMKKVQAAKQQWEDAMRTVQGEPDPEDPQSETDGEHAFVSSAQSPREKEDNQRCRPAGWRSQEVEAAANSGAANFDVAEAKRLGLEARIIGLDLEGFCALLPSVLRIQVVCNSCRKPSELSTLASACRLAPCNAEGACPVCNEALALQVVPNACRGGCEPMAHIRGMNCHPVHVLRSDFEAQCGECGEFARIRNVGAGYGKHSKCTSCSTKLNLAMDDLDLLGPTVARWRAVAAEEGERLNARKQLQEARKIERGLGVKVGQPLPEKGTCKHYKTSCRWLRFPCCGRAFPCDICHDEQTDHKAEWATRLLCGLCSHEQPFTKEQCGHCGAAQNTHAHGGFWEGGEGCRNRVLMAKNDVHKTRGLGKTVSNKKAAASKK